MKIIENKENRFITVDFAKSSILQFRQDEYFDFLKKNLDIYFNTKKATNISIEDYEGDIVERDKISFIDFSKKISYKDEIEIKNNSKTLEYINKYMEIHDTEFLAFSEMNTIRKEMKTDSGIYNIIKNISFGISEDMELLPKPLTFNSYPQNFFINEEFLEDIDIKLININCEILLNNEKQIIISIDEYFLSEKLIQWVNKLSKKSNIIFLINNKFELTSEIENLEISRFQYIIDNELNAENIEVDWEEYEKFLYSLRSRTKSTLKFQKKEIIDIFEDVNLQKKIIFIQKIENDMIAKYPINKVF